MFARETPLGCSTLLRVAGLPIRYWLAGANPTLFAKAVRLIRDEEVRHACAMQLAEQIGQQLVPNPALSREDRVFLLGVRRTFHSGHQIAKVSRERLLKVSGLSDEADGELLRALVAMVDRDRTIAMLLAEVETDLAQEQHRLLVFLPEETYHESQIAKVLLGPRDEPGLGSQLSRKARRRRCEHEWRRIARAATGSTPRGWLSHVALLPIEAADWLPSPAVTEQFTAQWMENVRARSLALTHPPDDWPAPESRLAVNPLRWDVDGHFVCVVMDDTREHTQVAVRHTSLLDAICTALADTVYTFEELAQALGCVNYDEWLSLRGFVRHLVVLGILQPSSPPLVRLERRAMPDQTTAHPAGFEDKGGWVDVYRHAEGGISINLARHVQRGVLQVLRVLSLYRNGTPDLCRLALLTSDQSWSLTEILRAELGAGDKSMSNSEDTEIVDDRSFPSASGFDRLVNTIAERAGHGGELIIDSSLLDECDGPNRALSWPVDCLVRLPAQGAGFTAVLDQLLPSGMLDARFVDTLVDMHGMVPLLEGYRAFLRELEQLTGILFVELLLPPLQDGAANAVRRPVYTSAWTGDPHTAAYLRSDTDPGLYLPLHAIRVRRIDGRLRAEVDGQPLWPVYHATRSFSPPWDRVARVLLATAPLDLPWDFGHMIQSLTRLPGQTVVPRISVSAGIVISPAQWRVSPEHLWDMHSPATAKLRALIRLRNRYSLPRWVCLDRGDDTPPVPCDLESIHAIRTIERCMKGSAPVNVIEMLPAPDQFSVVDRAHDSGDRLAAQFQLRFPCDESAQAMAARVAPAILAALGSPGRLRLVPPRHREAGPLATQHQFRSVTQEERRIPHE
ncbi:MAG TPA: lantibiotic dehydratase [Pyrinomonadaceae bacterium]|nr:lantibiotic dehydratase [Pyrinomonadaceae bacterium]